MLTQLFPPQQNATYQKYRRFIRGQSFAWRMPRGREDAAQSDQHHTGFVSTNRFLDMERSGPLVASAGGLCFLRQR